MQQVEHDLAYRYSSLIAAEGKKFNPATIYFLVSGERCNSTYWMFSKTWEVFFSKLGSMRPKSELTYVPETAISRWSVSGSKKEKAQH
jgi:hypothetical protein